MFFIGRFTVSLNSVMFRDKQTQTAANSAINIYLYERKKSHIRGFTVDLLRTFCGCLADLTENHLHVYIQDLFWIYRGSMNCFLQIIFSGSTLLYNVTLELKLWPMYRYWYNL